MLYAISVIPPKIVITWLVFKYNTIFLAYVIR